MLSAPTARPPADSSALDGKFRILLELGQGGTANVSLAIAKGLSGFNKLVVLKRAKPLVATQPELRRMFTNEARLCARLNHANIVQTNEVADDGGLPVIVMEYLDGQPFSELLARANGRLPLAMHLRMLCEALSGLHYAHECTDFDGSPLNIVHRDMTPHNVFVTYDGQVKILDFGIAKFARDSEKTEEGIIKGKLRYLSAEQITGEPVDRRADLYAVGVMLWEAAAGQALWKEDGERTILNRVINGDLPSPRSINPEVHAELERICLKALAADREDRHATAAELRADLEALMDQLGPRAESRDIGKLVASLFASEREATKRSIESQLQELAAGSWESTAEPERESLIGLAPAAPPPVVAPAEQPRRRPLFLGLAALLAALVVLLVGFRISRAPAVENAQASPSATGATSATSATGATSAASSVSGDRATTPSSAAPPVPSAMAARVRITVSATPPNARLFLDDAPVSGNPFTFTEAADPRPRVLRAEAPGYVTSSKTISFDKDAEVGVNLERSGAPRKNGGGHDAPPSTGTGTKRPASCTPPYYFDEQGTKKFKPECL